MRGPKDLNHSTDWTVVVSIVVSGMISFIGFLITVYIVKKLTEKNIIYNKQLVEAQKKLKTNELQFVYKSTEIDKFRNIVAEYFAL